MATDGRLVLVFDDGTVSDHETVLPALRAVDAPACFAVVSGWLDREGHLAVEQVRDLVDRGCEVLAHGREHRFLGVHHLARDAAAGDDRIYPVAGHVFPGKSSGVVPGDSYEVTDGSDAETVAVAGVESHDGDPCLELTDPLSGEYAAGETALRVAPEVIEAEVAGAGEDLRAAGFDVRGFVFPYDAADPRAWATAQRHYEVVPDAAVRSLPNPPGTPATNLRRYYFETDALTRPEIATYLDDVAGRDGLGILAGHGEFDTVTPRRIRWVVEAARERGIEVTTFRSLLRDAA